MKRIAVLGSTGSIGTQTLDVIRKLNREDFQVVAITCGHNFSIFRKQLAEFRPRFAAALEFNGEIANEFPETTFFFGEEGIEELIGICSADYTVHGITGATGLKYSLKAIEHTRRLCLANKESIVCGGKLLMEKADKLNVELIPVDSEHSGVFQSLNGDVRPSKIFITASGGALRDYPLDKIRDASLEEVLKHPVWSMGNKVTIDSATMVNKGLEIMEAHYLFDYGEKDILTYMCRNSLVHGGTIYPDGVVKFHVGNADMRIPIAYSLTYPQRFKTVESIDLTGKNFLLEELDYVRYPVLKVARSITGDPVRQIAFNAADEVAVRAFEKGKVAFGEIYDIITETVSKINESIPESYEQVIEIDRVARKIAEEVRI